MISPPLPAANYSFAFLLGQLALIKNFILFSLFAVIVEKHARSFQLGQAVRYRCRVFQSTQHSDNAH
jgi:hypothetical protein